MYSTAILNGGHFPRRLPSGTSMPKASSKAINQFHLVERIGSQVVYERRGRGDFRFVHAELLNNNLFLTRSSVLAILYPPRFCNRIICFISAEVEPCFVPCGAVAEERGSFAYRAIIRPTLPRISESRRS